jgi:hypothetical protein
VLTVVGEDGVDNLAEAEDGAGDYDSVVGPAGLEGENVAEPEVAGPCLEE